MKLPLLTAAITILAAIAIGFYQAHQLDNLTAYNNVLATENQIIATTGSTSPPTSPAPAGTAPQLEKSSGDPVVDATRFLDLIADMPAQPDQQKAQALLGQLAAAPKATLHALLDLVPARELPADASTGITGIVLSRLSEMGEPAFAMQHALKTDIPLPFHMSLFNSWADRDLAAATAWLETTSASDTLAPDSLAAATDALASARAKNAPLAAIEAAATLQGHQRADTLKDAVASLDSEQDWLSFARQAATIDDPAFRKDAIKGLVNGTINNPHLTDTRHLIDQLDLPPADLNDLILTATTQTFDSKTPERADWLISRSPAEHLDENLSRFVSVWTSNDFNATAYWLGELQPSPTRDTAVATFANIVAGTEPESAAEWALTIADESKKSTTLDNIIDTWHNADPAAATAYLEKKSAAR